MDEQIKASEMAENKGEEQKYLSWSTETLGMKQKIPSEDVKKPKHHEGVLDTKQTILPAAMLQHRG